MAKKNNVQYNQNNQIRCFVCIELDDYLKDEIEEITEKIKPLAPNLKWVSREALHLTLKFCGNISQPTVDMISRELKERLDTSRIDPFTLKLSGIGGFPNLKRPRVLWLGISGDLSPLFKLQLMVEKVCSSFKGVHKDEKSFSPHLTLARVKKPSDVTPTLIDFIANMKVRDISWPVEIFTFMKSDLTPRGAIYTPLVRYKLGGAL